MELAIKSDIKNKYFKNKMLSEMSGNIMLIRLIPGKGEI